MVTPCENGQVQPTLLQFCLLDVKVAAAVERCVLSNPRDDVEPAKIDLAPGSRVGMPLDKDSVPPDKLLRLDLAFDGLGPHEIKNGSGLKPGELCTVSIFDPGAEGEKKKFLDLEITFELNGNDRGLRVESFGFLRGREPSGEIKEVREPITRTRIERIQRDFCSPARISQFETNAAECQRKIDKHEESIATINTNIRDRQEQIKSGSDPFGNKQLHEKLKKEIERQIGLANTEKARLKKLEEPLIAEKKKQEELRDLANENAQWCKRMTALFDKLEDKAGIRYLVHVEIERTPVDVVHTTPDTAPEGER